MAPEAATPRLSPGRRAPPSARPIRYHAVVRVRLPGLLAFALSCGHAPPPSPAPIAPPPPAPATPPPPAPLLRLVEPPAGNGPGASYPVVAARVFAVGDSQLRHLYGRRTFAQSPFADRYQGIEVAIRPAALDDGGDLLLATFLDEHHRHHPRATLVYMGDAADLSCEQEYDRFFGLMAEKAEIPFLMVTSNHDGFYAGNFTSKLDGAGKLAYTDMPIDWMRACSEPGSLDDRILTKGRAVTRVAEALPPAPAWATQLAAAAPDDPAGYRTALLSYVRPLGGGDAGAPPAWGLFLDTVDYRDYDLTQASGAGTVGSVSADALRFLDLAMFEVMTTARGPRPTWLAFGHHPIAQLDPAAKERLLRFLDLRPEIVAYVSAHTHHSDEKTHHLPSGRLLPELVVGSTTDFGGPGAPQTARLVELRVDPRTGARAAVSHRLELDVDRLCAGVPALGDNDALGYTSYRLERDDTGDVPTGTWDLFWAWLEDDDLTHYRVAQTAGALLVENRLVRALAYLYRSAPGEVDEGARVELDALVARVSGPGIGWGASPESTASFPEYDRWWDPVLSPYVPLLARTLLSFGGQRYLFQKLRAWRTADPERRRWFTCHAARAAAEESRRGAGRGRIFIR
jgi:hypothetical protein